MFKIEKRFSFPMGHRLCNHSGSCFNFHGHNYEVLVGMKSESLNTNDMVIDFGFLKTNLKSFFNILDHSLMINSSDKDTIKFLKEKGMKILEVDYDPTAERMCKEIYDTLEKKINELKVIAENESLELDYITIFENKNSKATYTKD